MIRKIRSLYRQKFCPRIIQFSPIRSGSTLIYNLLRETYPNSLIVKQHNITEELCAQLKVVVSFRNPIDSLASSFKRYKLPVTKDNIKRQIDELKKNGLDDLVSVFENPNILKLKYESFYDNFDVIFNEMELYFGVPISNAHRDEMKKKYHVSNLISIINKYNSFGKYDEITYLHGNHISESKGKPNSFTSFFEEEDIYYISNQLYDLYS